MTNLSNRESFLVALTFAVVVATVILSLSISLVLPNHITSKPKKYVSNMENKSENELKDLCGCLTKSSKKTVDCKPHKIENEGFKSSLDCNAKEWNLQKSFSYLAALTEPAYVDDEDVRIFVCAGVIISNYHILAGFEHKSEEQFKKMRVRVGSIYWSKGGVEINGFSIATDYRGLLALKMNTKLSFNAQIRALQLPSPGKALPVESAVTLDWETNKLHNIFHVKNWISYQCENYDITGEIRNGPDLEGAKSLLLVTVQRMLVGVLGNITYDDDDLTYVFADLQCDSYPSWLYYAIDKYGDGRLRPISTKCDEDDLRLVYQGEHCDDPKSITTSIDDFSTITSNDDISTISFEDTSTTSTDDTSTTSTDNTSTTSTDDTSTTATDDTSTTSTGDTSTTISTDNTQESKDIFKPIIFGTDPTDSP